MIEVAGGGERLGVCLDSCHLLASGYEVRERAAFRRSWTSTSAIVGLDRLRALHLNDSKVGWAPTSTATPTSARASWARTGIRVFLGEPRFKGLPVLLEVPGPDGHGPDKAAGRHRQAPADAGEARRRSQALGLAVRRSSAAVGLRRRGGGRRWSAIENSSEISPVAASSVGSVTSTNV